MNPFVESSYNEPRETNQFMRGDDGRPKTHHTHQRPHFTEVNQPPVPVEDNLINEDNSPFSNSKQYQGNGRRFQSNNVRPTTHGAGHSHANFQNATFEEFKAIPNNLMSNTSQLRQQPPMNPAYRKSSQQPQRNNYNSQDKDNQRRQFIAQMLNQQNSSIDNPQNSKQYHVLNFNNAISKRKKIKELIYGQSQKSSLLQQKEKEELLQEKRYLKIQQNAANEENIKLKTRIQQLQNELGKRDKDIEQLVIQYQNLLHTQKGANFQVDSNIYESFMVSQLKRTNRELKFEVSEKDKVIDSLKKDSKMTKGLELETELQVYIAECGRLRGLLEQAFFERQSILQNQNQDDQFSQQQQFNTQKMEEAFFEKENQLQKERELRNQIQVNYMSVKEQLDKATEKAKLAESRVKKMNELQSQTKRQEIMLRQKNKELIELKSQIEGLKQKASERDSVYNKNKELVTKQYALQSRIDAQEKQIQQLKQQNENLNDQSRFISKGGVGGTGAGSSTLQNPSPNRTASTPSKLPPSLPKQITRYNDHYFTFIQRSMNQQQILQTNDKQPYRNYVQTYRVDLDKDLEQIKNIVLSKETRDILLQKQDLVISNLSKNFTYNQIEKFLEEQVQILDKDQRRYIIFNNMVKHSQSPESFNMSKLLSDLKNPSFIASDGGLVEDNGTVRVNESVGETTGQFMPPSNFNTTPIVPDDQFKGQALGQDKGGASAQKEKTPVKQIEEEGDEYEEDNFEQQEKEEEEQKQSNTKMRSLSDLRKENQEKEEQEAKSERYQEEGEEENYDDGFENPDEVQNAATQENEQELNEGEAQEQITEEQMLDIAESVFEMIGERLKEMNMSVFKVFGENAQIIEQFEDKENVEVVGAREFLESLEKLQISDLTQLQVACLMQVLSRPELEHSIILNELQMVLNNFGVPEEAQEEKQKSQEQLVSKKQKQTKKKQIQNLIKKEKSPVYGELFDVMRVCDFNIDVLSDILQEKCYEQLVKQKGKEVSLILIKKEDFFGIIKEKTGVQVSSETQEMLTPILQLDSKYQEIYQLKTISILFQEVMQRIKKEEDDQQKLEAFYNPQMQGSHVAPGQEGEVMNFEQMMENYEDDYEKDELNAIAEDQREESASPTLGRSQLKSNNESLDRQ